MATLNIYLIKDELSDPDDVIVDRESLRPFDVRVAGELIGVLFIRPTIPKPPGWLQYFASYVDFGPFRVETASSGALLFVQRGQRLFAVTFGSGKWLLFEGSWEERFGLRATLNAVDPTKLRSLDHKRLDAVSRTTREQVSQESPIQNFGLDVERDLLKSVTGVPMDRNLGDRLTGRDSLSVSAKKIPVTGLRSYLDRVYELSTGEDYREHFGWVDNIREITDKDLVDQLNDRLIELIQSGQWEGVSLAPPEIIDWTDVSGFAYSNTKNAKGFANMNFEDYLAERRSPDEVSMRRLRSDKVRVVSDDDGADRARWSVYRSLALENRLGRKCLRLE